MRKRKKKTNTVVGGMGGGIEGIFGQDDDAVALLDEKGGFVYSTTCWHRAAAVDGLILGMTMIDSFIYL